MVAEFRLHILSADRDFYDGPCTSAVLPVSDGFLGVLANRSDMAAAVVPGILTFQLPNGEKHEAVVSHGLARVERNELLVLVGSAERPEEIDAARAERAAAAARERLLQRLSRQEGMQIQANLTRAMMRMKAANRK